MSACGRYRRRTLEAQFAATLLEIFPEACRSWGLVVETVLPS